MTLYEQVKNELLATYPDTTSAQIKTITELLIGWLPSKDFMQSKATIAPFITSDTLDLQGYVVYEGLNAAPALLEGTTHPFTAGIGTVNLTITTEVGKSFYIIVSNDILITQITQGGFGMMPTEFVNRLGVILNLRSCNVYEFKSLTPSVNIYNLVLTIIGA